MKRKIAMIIAVLAMCTGCANNSSSENESLADVKTSQYQQEISSSSQQETTTQTTTQSTAETESKKSDEDTDEFDKSKIPEAPRNIKICMRYDGDDFMNFVGFKNDGGLLYEDSAFGQFENSYIHLKEDKRQHVVLK